MLAVRYSSESLSYSRPIAVALIGQEHAGHIGQPLQAFVEDGVRGRLVPPALHQNIEEIPVLVDRAPPIVTLVMDSQKDLAEGSPGSWLGASTTQLMGLDLPARRAHRLIAQAEAVRGHVLFDAR